MARQDRRQRHLAIEVAVLEVVEEPEAGELGGNPGRQSKKTQETVRWGGNRRGFAQLRDCPLR